MPRGHFIPKLVTLEFCDNTKMASVILNPSEALVKRPNLSILNFPKLLDKLQIVMKNYNSSLIVVFIGHVVRFLHSLNFFPYTTCLLNFSELRPFFMKFLTENVAPEN